MMTSPVISQAGFLPELYAGLFTLADAESSVGYSILEYLSDYSLVFVAAFLVTLLITPVIRRVAIAHDVVDHPDDRRKAHAHPVAYMGGLAVFFGLIVAIALSYSITGGVIASSRQVPFAIIIGMIAIAFTGLADDIWGWDPRLKMAGQLVAAAALAVEEVGVLVAKGALLPVAVWLDPILGCENLVFIIPTLMGEIHFDTIYWVGTAIIAIFVLGGCNAANLIDGLDGLLSGVTGIVAIGLLAICLLMVVQEQEQNPSPDARRAGELVQQHVEIFYQEREVYPSSLSVLVEEEFLDRLPQLPKDWTPLRYDPGTGAVEVDTVEEAVDYIIFELEAQVDRFKDEQGQYPRRLTDLVDSGIISALPDFPEGWSAHYDPADKGLVMAQGPLTGARIVLCMALLGAVLGFLPHNFNPATIFLGDCGSLLLGYMCVVIILMLGELGQTHLVFAGLIVFSIPIMDTILAIIRRKLAGTSMSAADDQHIHHQLKRSLGGVKRAVFALYGIGLMFAVVGVSLAALVMFTEMRVRVVYAIALVLFSFIGAIAVKAARRQQLTISTREHPDATESLPTPAAVTPSNHTPAEDDPHTDDESGSPPPPQNSPPAAEPVPHTTRDPEPQQSPPR